VKHTDYHTSFPASDLEFSETAARKAIDNRIPDPLTDNAKRLSHILALLKDDSGWALTITSGYRSPALNDAVGGSRSSDHMHALAADIVVHGVAPNVVATRFAQILAARHIGFNQIIVEFGRWTHLGLTKPGATPSNELLTARKLADNGRLITVYTKGIA
jgi:hypothetical protein